MAISTNTKAIDIKYDGYKGISEFQERALASSQARYDTVQEKINKKKLLLTEYNKHNQDDATAIEKEYTGKINELGKSLKSSADADRVLKEYYAIENAYNTDARIKDLSALNKDYNLSMKLAMAATDSDTRARAVKEVDDAYAMGKRDEDGGFNLTPAQGLTYYDLPAIASAALPYAQLKKASGNTTQTIDDRSIKKVISPDGLTTYHTVRKNSKTGIDSTEVYNSLEDVILSDSTVTGYLDQVERRGGENGAELRATYEGRFKTQLGGIAELAGYKNTVTSDQVIGKRDNVADAVALRQKSPEDITNDILENGNNAGTNQVSVVNTKDNANVNELKETKDVANKALEQIRQNIVVEGTVKVGGIPMPEGMNMDNVGTKEVDKVYSAEKIDILNRPMMRQPGGGTAPMTPQQMNNYNLFSGQSIKATARFNDIRNTALAATSTSLETYKEHERFLTATQAEQEEMLSRKNGTPLSYKGYEKKFKEILDNSDRNRAIVPEKETYTEWSSRAYKDVFDFDIEPINKAMDVAFAKDTYKTTNKSFITYKGIKEAIGTTNFNKTTPEFKKTNAILENRERRYKESPEDILSNASNIMIQTADDQATNVQYSDEDFLERVFPDGLKNNTEVSYLELGTNWDAEDGGIEKVQVTGVDEDGVPVKKLIFVQDPDVEKLAAYYHTKKPNTEVAVNDLKESFKNAKSDLISYTTGDGVIQYSFEKLPNGNVFYTYKNAAIGTPGANSRSEEVSLEDAGKYYLGALQTIYNHEQ